MKKSVSGIQMLAVLFAGTVLGLASNASADEFTVDGGHSSVLFRVMHNKSAPFYGRFNDVEGSFTIDDDPTKSSFEITVKTESIDSNNKKRDAHLKSPDFFNAREFPTLTFKSSKVEKGENGALKVTGDLNCHGVTKSITIDIEVTGSNTGPRGTTKGIETIFTIKRSDFGVNYGLEGGGLGDDVRIIVALEGGK